MTDHELLLKILEKVESMDTRLETVEGDVSAMTQDITTLTEHVTVRAVNEILDWADDASIQIVPLFRRAK